MNDAIGAASPSYEFPSHLVEGYRTFLTGRFPSEHERFRELAEKGQRPRTMIIGCSNSRVSPEAIFDAGPGELFVLRNIANLIPPYEPDDHYHGVSSALEYAVMALKVRHIVVLGHAQCGGVAAFAGSLADPDAPPLSEGDFIGRWIQLLRPAAERAGPLPAGWTAPTPNGSNSRRSSRGCAICAASPGSARWKHVIICNCMEPISGLWTVV